jgi:energy-coupling factor transporter ATP-binding protein EcfA2
MTGFEGFAAQAVSGIAVPIFQSLWGTGTKFLGVFGKTVDEKTKQLIFNASGEYVKNYSKRHGTLKVLGMTQPVDLEDVYTAVQLLDQQGIRNYESLQNLEQVFRESNSRSFQGKDCQKQVGTKVANDTQYLMVLGQPGAGKSTFLKKMGLEALQGKKGEYKHKCIPVFIELKEFTTDDIDIKKAIIKDFEVCNFPNADKFTDEALKQGKLLILLDGLDEVPTDNQDKVIGQIQNFVDQHDKNRFICSCRTAVYRHNFKRFNDVVMAEFDDEQIKQFIYNWFQSDVDYRDGTAERCYSLLQKEENKAAKELAQTPLLLTFLCLVYNRSQDLPKNRAVLYKDALNILLKEWAAEKRVRQDALYQDFSLELEQIMLSEIAYAGFEADRLFFSGREVVEQIKTFLQQNLNAPKHLDGEKILDTIAKQQGILVERSTDVYSFSHLTLQEYLTAQYIADNNQIEQLVNEHLTDQRWSEVFLLVAGLVRSRNGADDLLLLMEKAVQKYINTPKLQGLLRWADELTADSEGDFKGVGKRAVAIAIAIANAYAYAIAIFYAYAIANAYAYAYAIAIANANAYAYAYAYAIANFIANAIANAKAYAKANTNAYANFIANAIANAKQLEEIKIFKDVNWSELIAQLEELKTQVPGEDEPQEVRQIFYQRFAQTRCNALHLDPELINLSKEESTALENYLYANWLILRCKEASVLVSAKTWEAIESRMLLSQIN